MLVGATGHLFVYLDFIVGGAALGGAVNVNKALAAEIAVDFLCLCGHDDSNVRDMAPTGGKDQAGGHAEPGVNLAQNLKALFSAGCAYADNVPGVYGVRVDGGTLDGEGVSRCPGSGGG